MKKMYESAIVDYAVVLTFCVFFLFSILFINEQESKYNV